MNYRIFVRLAEACSAPRGPPAAPPPLPRTCTSPFPLHLAPSEFAAMTVAADPEWAEGTRGAAASTTGAPTQRQQRMWITAAALAATVLLALVADRLSCRCGPALAARWLRLRPPKPPCTGVPNFIL